MINLLVRYSSLLLFAALILSTPAAAAPGDVKASFPVPCRFPGGLASDGTYLYVLDWRDAKLLRINPADGALVQSWDAPTLKPYGLAHLNGRLYISDDRTGRIYAFNPESGLIESSFAGPGKRVLGLAAAEDNTLFLLEAESKKIYRVMPEDGTILGYFDLPEPTCAAMTYDGRYLWVSDRIKNELYMVAPQGGTVIAIVDAPGPYATGLAWHDGHLWNTDLQERKLYQLVIEDKQMYRLRDPRQARVEYHWALYNYGPGDVRDLIVNVAVPDELPNQELLSEPEFFFPTSTSGKANWPVEDRWGQKLRIFGPMEVPAGQKAVVGYAIDAKTSAIRYLIIPEKTGTLEDIPAEIRKAYTVDGSRYRLESAYIQKLAKEIVGDEKNPYWIARKIYNHVISKLEYEMVGGWDVPEVVLERGSGSCSEYTFAFIALCRAAGLPARYQGSIVVRGDDASIDEAFHRWAQVYLPNYGWVPVDANRGDKPSAADQARGFGELANKFLITTNSGGDSEFLRWGYNSHATWGATGYCNVEEENFGFWEPLGEVKQTGQVSQATGGATAATRQP